MKDEGLPNGISRRAFLWLTAAAPFALHARTAASKSSPALKAGGLIDVNIHLFRWPLRRLPNDETPALLAKLRHYGVSQAWAGSYEGLLHKDLGAVNARLTTECRQLGSGLLLPFGSVNPKTPGWEEELGRCAHQHHMPGIRLHPNYHGYELDDPDFLRLLRQATDNGLIVQLTLLMEDERMMHPLLRVAPVDPAPLPKAVGQTPGVRLVLLNALGALRGESMRRVLGAGQVYVEIATLEGVGGAARLLEEAPSDRVLFGSHAPFFYFESALMKMQESLVSEEQLSAVRNANARRLLAASGAPRLRRKG